MRPSLRLVDLALPAPVRSRRRALRSRVAFLRRRIARLAAGERARLESQARALDPIRERIALLTGQPACCATCAARLPDGLPSLPGGHCCSSVDGPITLCAELAVLLLAGHRPDRRRPTGLDHGCLFRSRQGCTLAPRERPSLCVRYMCSELTRELSRGDALPEILALSDTLEAASAQIAQALLERIEPAGQENQALSAPPPAGGSRPL